MIFLMLLLKEKILMMPDRCLWHRFFYLWTDKNPITHQKPKASNNDSSFSAIFFGNKGDVGRVCVLWVITRLRGCNPAAGGWSERAGEGTDPARHAAPSPGWLRNSSCGSRARGAAYTCRSLLLASPIPYSIGTSKELSSRLYTYPLGQPKSKIHTRTELKVVTI